MSITVNIQRESRLYGDKVLEKWKLQYEDGEGAWRILLRVLPEEGSKPELTRDVVPIGGVPTEVLDKADEMLEEAAGVSG
jgi:hypothetical protein